MDDAACSASRGRFTRSPGGEFNIGSPKQLREVLFDEIEAAGRRSGPAPTGEASTDQETLEKLAALGSRPAAADHRASPDRQAQGHLRRRPAGAGESDDGPRPRVVQPDGRRDGPAQLAATRTCRTSRSAPRRAGRSARRSSRGTGWTAPDRRLFADRAAAAGPLLRRRRRSSRPSPRTATFTPPSPPRSSACRGGGDADQRRVAKTVNFGVIYGMSAFGLATRLGITQGGRGRVHRRLLRPLPVGAGVPGTIAPQVPASEVRRHDPRPAPAHRGRAAAAPSVPAA